MWRTKVLRYNLKCSGDLRTGNSEVVEITINTPVISNECERSRFLAVLEMTKREYFSEALGFHYKVTCGGLETFATLHQSLTFFYIYSSLYSMFGGVAEVKLPDKIYFRIGEVSEYTGVQPYVLRYWENEFQEIQPIRRKSQMLYEQNYTIAGAKKKLREEVNQRRVSTKVNELLREILSELKSIK